MLKKKDFYKQLAKKPDDWDLRGIFADWLHENGFLAEEKAQRYLIERRKCPCFWAEKFWIFSVNLVGHFQLEKSVFDKIKTTERKYKIYMPGVLYHYFSTLEKAEIELSKVFDVNL